MKQLILGGARSGKSLLAEALAKKTMLPVTYIATASAGDNEMAARIKEHKARRPASWTLIEEPLFLADTLQQNATADQCILVDCLTLWLTNLLISNNDQLLEQQLDALAHILPRLTGEIIFVSNETNMGITPMDALTRRYCDEIGGLHQQMAQIVDRVILTVAGLPQILKGDAL